jgi:serine/threonine-protein kinase
VLEPGALLDGKYQVVRPIGQGGMGAVFEGLSVRLNRRVAIKVLHKELARDRTVVMRFEREAQAAANLASVHVVKVFDLGDLPGGDRYMVMEFLEGESLHARLRAENRLAPPVIAKIVIQLLEGLASVHQAGIVHRDLKPANVFLCRREGGDEVVKVLDFGVCKMTEGGGSREFTTGVGALLGTLAYMSPEQVEHGAKNLDGRADLYAVGVILYRAVTGALPYGATSLAELLGQLRAGHAPRIDALAADVDPRFAAIVTRALEWDRSARYATAGELQRELVDWLASIARLEEVLSEFLAPSSSQSVGRVALVSKPRRDAAAEPSGTGPPPPPVAAPVEEVAPTTTRTPKKADRRSQRRTLRSEDASEGEIEIDLDDEG